MGRSIKGGATSHRRPGDPRETAVWASMRATLWRTWTGNGAHAAVCYHCQHPIQGIGEVQHLISPRIRPELAMAESNLRPSHGGGKKRCPTCGLACNPLAAGNAAARDAEGRPLPFTDQFIREAQERTKTGQRPAAGRPAASGRHAPADPGRDWDKMAAEQQRAAVLPPARADSTPVEPNVPAQAHLSPEPVPGSPEWFMRHYPEWA